MFFTLVKKYILPVKQNETKHIFLIVVNSLLLNV